MEYSKFKSKLDTTEKEIAKEIFKMIEGVIVRVPKVEPAGYYKQNLISAIMELKKECGLLPKYDTLREYINANSNGAYHHFIFDIENQKVNIISVYDFEHYYNSHFLDDYVVIADDKKSNDGDCTSYICEHTLTIKHKKYMEENNE